MNWKIFVAFLSVVANLALAIGKLIIGFVFGVGAIFADGINSATDVIASGIGYFGIKISEKPADKEHPYGHGKAEVISGFVITLIIFVSGIFIIIEAIRELLNPSPIEMNYLVFLVMAISAGVNGFMSYLKIYFGKKYNSIGLISDGVHSRIDLLVSLGIFIGLFFINYFPKLDPILALLVGVYILRESFYLGKEATDSLLGTSAGEEIESKIKNIIKKNKSELSSLKTQKIGNKIFAEIKITLPSKLKVEEATNITKNLQDKLVKEIKDLDYVSIQIEGYDTGVGYYRSIFGRGFGWQKKEKDSNHQIQGAQGKGPEGYCMCPKCGYKKKHEKGIPCSSIKCPKCKINLERK